MGVLLVVLISAVYTKRDPKLFFVSTSSTTSTLTTASTCYSQSGTAATCGTGRRRRSLITDGALKDDEKLITASRLEPSINEPEAKSQREGKFLLYWLTTTTTSTSTTFSATNTITIQCTPVTGLSACP